MKRPLWTVTLCAFALAAFAASTAGAVHAQTTANPQATPTPILPPAALPSPAGNTATITLGSKAKATPAPPKDTEDNRVGITGVWEVALQKPDGVTYTHFKITQVGTALTGQYLDDAGKKYPLAGTIDGKSVRLVVTLPNGTALVFTGTEDGNTDMVGTLSTAKDLVGFTAAYRPKFKWIDNISPGGSGLGSMVNPGGVP